LNFCDLLRLFGHRKTPWPRFVDAHITSARKPLTSFTISIPVAFALAGAAPTMPTETIDATSTATSPSADAFGIRARFSRASPLVAPGDRSDFCALNTSNIGVPLRVIPVTPVVGRHYR
jgi:hypothetical protein